MQKNQWEIIGNQLLAKTPIDLKDKSNVYVASNMLLLFLPGYALALDMTARELQAIAKVINSLFRSSGFWLGWISAVDLKFSEKIDCRTEMNLRLNDVRFMYHFDNRWLFQCL